MRFGEISLKRKIIWCILTLLLILVFTFLINEYNKNSSKKTNYPYIVSAFSGHNGSNLDLYTTNNLKDFKPLNKKKLFEPPSNNLRDPSIIFYNHHFYVCYTGRPENKPGFMVAESPDLIHWDQHYIDIPKEYITTYAPQWFVDGDKISILLSLTNGIKENDIFNNNILFFKSYIMISKDRSLMNYTLPMPINYSKNDNHIDPCMTKRNGKYYIFVKNEHDRLIDEFVSDQLIGNYSFIQTINFGDPVEGPSIIRKNGRYYLFADKYTLNESSLVTSYDLLTWSKPMKVESTDKVRTQHFDIFHLNAESYRIAEKLSEELMGN
ncbi:hypothetical protein EWI07_03980 [Sporolactobacillus sp. THM7-4]|nr:hypothetical protein EWI07_03980 [Sporolactobacillus sp. THM7-4]